MLNRITIVALILWLPAFALRAQEKSCEQTLNDATDEFNAGRFYGIPAMLANCIESGFTREQRQRAFLLLTQTYLLLDDPLGAEHSYLEVLKANPEYAPDPMSDPIDLVYLGKKFTASPIFSVFGRAGINFSPVRVIHSVPAYSGLVPEITSYSIRPGFQLAAGFDWHFAEQLALSAELAGLGTQAYRRTRANMFGGQDYQVVTDRLTMLNSSFALKYAFNRFMGSQVRKFVPQAYLGISFSFLVSDKATFESFNNDPSDAGFNTIIAGPVSLNLLPYRNRFSYQIFGGAAVKYKFGLDYLFVDLRYTAGMANLVKPESTFPGQPAQEFGHVDDYFRLDNIALSVGYIKPFYHPRKLKRARTRSVIKQIQKSDAGSTDN